MKEAQREKAVLVTGATGYVGGRLVVKLAESGWKVKAMGRNLAKLAARPWAGHPLVEMVVGDAMDPASLHRACQGCWAAFYLVHSMNPQTRDFAAQDRASAVNMAAAAAAVGLDRIIYLGGLVPVGQRMSHHLESRAEVGRILQSGPVPVTVLRAAMILGSGSASFEIMRYLVDRLPVMITPLWVRSLVQPISIRNVLGYLAGCLEHPETAGETYDICGPDVMAYQDLFQIYAELAGLAKRRIIPVHVLTPKLSAYWIHLVTPVHASLARPLAEGLANTVVCTENRIREVIPQDLLDCRRAIARIMEKRQQQIVETCWSDAGNVSPPEWVQKGDAGYAGGTVINASYRVVARSAPGELWGALISIGGDKGWYHADWLWRLRGRLDKLVGGVSVSRGRRNRQRVSAGDALDFWRVLAVKEESRLLLVAEMKAPGEAVLDFQLLPRAEGNTELRMIGRFLPRGLAGLAYWHFLRPFHAWLFKGTLKGLLAAAGVRMFQGPEPFHPKDEELCFTPD